MCGHVVINQTISMLQLNLQMFMGLRYSIHTVYITNTENIYAVLLKSISYITQNQSVTSYEVFYLHILSSFFQDHPAILTKTLAILMWVVTIGF